MRSFLVDHCRSVHWLAIAVMAARGCYCAVEEIATAMGRPPRPVLVLLQRDIASGAAQQDIDDFGTALSSAHQRAAQSPRTAWLSPNEA